MDLRSCCRVAASRVCPLLSGKTGTLVGCSSEKGKSFENGMFLWLFYMFARIWTIWSILQVNSFIAVFRYDILSPKQSLTSRPFQGTVARWYRCSCVVLVAFWRNSSHLFSVQKRDRSPKVHPDCLLPSSLRHNAYPTERVTRPKRCPYPIAWAPECTLQPNPTFLRRITQFWSMDLWKRRVKGHSFQTS